MKIAITGAGGFIGNRLRNRFHDHVILDRDLSVSELEQKLAGAGAVINLAGAPIIKRWTTPYKDILRKSRIDTTARVVDAMNRTGNTCHLVSVSATGIYPQGRACDEECPERAHDFLGDLAQEWEQEAMRYQGPVTILRLGVVLGPDGGALSKMLLPFRLGVGGPIGSGRMVMSWVDISDLVRMFEFVLDNALTGIFNAVAPNPVTNREFSRTLAGALARPAFLPVPVPVLRLIYGEAASVLAGSWEIYPKRLIETGYVFQYPTIQESLNHLLSQPC
jgi:uncharacterized protein (TIGR01777 family)